MKWIKASERLPEKFDRVNWRYEITKIPISYRTSYQYAINKDKSHLVEWLDENIDAEGGKDGAVLKDYVVVLDDVMSLEIWTTDKYNLYVKRALSVGATPAVKIITTFNREDDFLFPKSTPKEAAAPSMDKIENADKAFMAFNEMFPDYNEEGFGDTFRSTWVNGYCAALRDNEPAPSIDNEIKKRDDTIKKLVAFLHKIPLALGKEMDEYLLKLDKFYSA